MASCATCRKTILFGGVRDGALRFCNATCHGQATLLLAAREVPAELVRAEAQAIQRGACPRCGRRGGPVDLHRTFRVHSLVLVTKWVTRTHVCCRGCATRSRLLDTLYCAALGWWGFPWGLLVTPVQIVRNLAGLVGRDRALGAPSPELEQAVRMELAARQPARSAATA